MIAVGAVPCRADVVNGAGGDVPGADEAGADTDFPVPARGARLLEARVQQQIGAACRAGTASTSAAPGAAEDEDDVVGIAVIVTSGGTGEGDLDLNGPIL